VTYEASLVELIGAITELGLEPPSPPADPAAVDAIAEAIAPMRLPEDVRTFWRDIDPWTLKVRPFPMLARPGFCLDAWRQDRKEFPDERPSSLFLLGYESWNCMSVELDTPSVSGGALFQWRLDATSFYLSFHSFRGWLERMTTLLSQGSFERRAAPSGEFLLLHDARELSLATPRVELPAHPRYGDLREIPANKTAWPEHWRQASGFAP
jgi:hypothetical protein